MKSKYIVSGLLIFLISFTASAQDTIAARYSKYISGDLLKKHLMVLASDSLEGRETAQPGMVKATRYVADQFAHFGIPPVAGKSYFQKIPLVDYSGATAQLVIAAQTYIQGNDFLVVDAPQNVDIKTSDVVFAGYGITDSVSGWNDYKGLDASQKIILILDGEPKNKKGNYLLTKTKNPGSWNADRGAKIQLAKTKNPKAIIFISG